MEVPSQRIAEGCGELRIAQAVVDVVAAQAAHQRRSQIELFQRAVRAGQGADAVGAVVSLDLFEAVGHVFKRGLPVDGFPFTALLEHGAGQALVAIQGFIREAVTVGNPAFVDVFVLEEAPHA
jgi:hypothetical protein